MPGIPLKLVQGKVGRGTPRTYLEPGPVRPVGWMEASRGGRGTPRMSVAQATRGRWHRWFAPPILFARPPVDRDMSRIKESMKRAMQELERTTKRTTQRATEVARSVSEDAAATWNESIRPGLEPLEQQTRAQASAIGDEILRAVEAAQGKVREVLGDDESRDEDEVPNPGDPGDR